jgi:transcriptional regulator with XRE-family HTH domain
VTAVLETAAPPAPPALESPLARARVHRQLTLEEAARRAGIPEEQVHWLEEGRIYRFASGDHALLALLLYATALGIDHDEALVLAGRPARITAARTNPWARIGVLLGIGAIALVGTVLALTSGHGSKPAVVSRSAAAAPALPPPWSIRVRVLNGSGDINYTRQLASKIGALGYTIAKVGKANNFRYTQTVVYYAPGGDKIALRLAKQVDATVAALPGGTNPSRLVVIAGPAGFDR